MSIELLARIDEVTSGTYFAVNINGQDYRVSAGDVLAHIQSGVESNGSVFTTQYAAPNSTDFSIQITNGSADIHLILTPSEGFADGEIVLPPLSGCVDGQQVLVNCTQDVASFVVDGNGGTVYGAPGSFNANACFTLKLDKPTGNWYLISGKWEESV